VQPDEIFVFDIDGNIVHHPGGLIPLEWRIHTRIHRDRPECMCIAHLHARHATVLGIAGHDLVPVFLHGSFLHGGVPTWNNPRLVVNDAQAADLSRALGDKIAGADARSRQRRGRRQRRSRVLRLHLPGGKRLQATGGRDHRRRIALSADEARDCSESTYNPRSSSCLWTFYESKVAACRIMGGIGRQATAELTRKDPTNRARGRTVPGRNDGTPRRVMMRFRFGPRRGSSRGPRSAALSIAVPARRRRPHPLNRAWRAQGRRYRRGLRCGNLHRPGEGLLQGRGARRRDRQLQSRAADLPAICHRRVQVSGSAVTPALFNAFARGITMKLVADKGQVARGFGFAAIVIRSDLADTVRDFKDLKGRKFAVMGKGVSSTTQLGKALELGGVEPNEVEFVELGLPEMVAALGNKAIDGATLLEPFITFATARNVGIRWKGMEDFLPFTGQNGVIIYSQKFAQEQPEAAKRWMAAYLKGTRAYLDSVTNGTDRDGINAILAKYTAVKDLALLAKMAPTGFDPNGRMEIKSLEADQDWFLKLGLQQGRADLGKVIDYQYVDDAVARLGKR
jgi:ABC-type nitrate/sulfonate/bicarbonate transport system substrate-binding protein